MAIADYIKTDDFKTEKHVPVIEAPAAAGKDEFVEVRVSVGKDIPHPNTTEHFIMNITLFYKADSGKPVYQLGRAEFTAHGEAVAGANQGPAHTDPVAVFKVKLSEPGTLTALSYCNIHGLWESSVKIEVK